MDHDRQPGLRESERTGRSEDFFTNRDVLNAAISADDGKTWHGFRELYRNDRRNDGDFRSTGGNSESLDKSIHQSQALELPEGKVLLAFGQHDLCRRLRNGSEITSAFFVGWHWLSERQDTFYSQKTRIASGASVPDDSGAR